MGLQNTKIFSVLVLRSLLLEHPELGELCLLKAPVEEDAEVVAARLERELVIAEGTEEAFRVRRLQAMNV